MTNFRPYEPDQQLLLPPSLRDWIPPDHRTICRFREQHLAAFERLFVQVVQIAGDAGLVRMGTLAVDRRLAGLFIACVIRRGARHRAVIGRPVPVGRFSILRTR